MFFARHQLQSAQEVATMRRRKGCNVFNALIRRETNCRRTNDHDLLLSYAEDTSVVYCNRTEVGFVSLVMSFYRRSCIGIWCYCCCLVVDLLQKRLCDVLELKLIVLTRNRNVTLFCLCVSSTAYRSFAGNYISCLFDDYLFHDDIHVQDQNLVNCANAAVLCVSFPPP